MNGGLTVGGYHLPLMEEGKGHTQRHVVDAEWEWVSLLCSVLMLGEINKAVHNQK